MNPNLVKEKLNSHIGKEAIIKYSLGRNKYEKYKVVIKELYKNIFLVEVKDENKEIKSFTYSDVITKTIKIDF
ncbi:MAG: Veg family protein [Firmicutes bacterium]|nr:Veg family protein [Bacillota bacterium]